MEGKGICSECIYDDSCKYNRKFPVENCEEYTIFKDKETN